MIKSIVTTHISTRLTQDKHMRTIIGLGMISDEDGRSASYIMRSALDEYIKNRGKSFNTKLDTAVKKSKIT